MNAAHASLGVALVGAHAVGFALLAQRCTSDEFVVEVRGANASPSLTLTGDIPEAFADRVRESTDDAPPGPGLHRKRWSIDYRGGFSRSVGAAQLVGPFQDPTAHTCSGRVAVSQRLLDDGSASPATVAGQMRRVLDRELAGQSITGAGDYTRIASLALRWARLEWHPDDRAMVKDAPNGYVRAAVTIELERVDVPVVIALIPTPATGSEFRFRIASRAELEFGNRVAQWISDHLGGNSLATRLAREQIDGALLSALVPPPPFDLGDGQSLTFTYCSDPPEIVEGTFGALPFAVEIGRVDRDPTVLPPRRGRAQRLAIAKDANLALDLDLDALNAVLFELWRGGFLDRQLEAAGLHVKFNADPIVQELLSLRISPARLALPPVLAPAGDHLRLSADARVTIADGGSTTTGRVWGGLDFQLGGEPLDERPTLVGPVDVRLGALELSCERTAVRLAPCYGDLVAAIRGRGSEFHGALTGAFAAIVSDIFVERRVGAEGLPADLVIQRAVPRVTARDGNGSLHLDLTASLVPTAPR